MITISLTRTHKTGNAVYGTMIIPYRDEPYATQALENADYLIPAGEYRVEMTWSSKFKKLLPQILDVPERECIRIHMGTKPEHSTGCVLVNHMTMMVLKGLITATEKRNSFNQNPEDNEEISICIVDDYGA